MNNTTTQKRPYDPYRTKKLVTVSMLAAIAFVCVAVIRIPVVAFLKYEPKDCIIAIAAFLYGPAASTAITVAVSFIEMITISDTGIIGFFMNVTATLLFTLPAALMYRRKKTFSTAITGLLLGTALMSAGMILWNYIMTPLYMGWPRADIAAMLAPVFLPFNLFKGGLNTAITLLIYKKIAQILRKLGALEPSSGETGHKSKKSLAITATCAAAVITLVFVLLAWRGII